MEAGLTDLQLLLLRVLWERGEATVLEVQEALAGERRLAQSTIATLLSRMEKKNLVGHRTEGRQYLYSALVTEEAVRRSAVAEFTAQAKELFNGDVAAVMSHLLDEQAVDPGELARVRAMIEAKEAELRRAK